MKISRTNFYGLDASVSQSASKHYHNQRKSPDGLVLSLSTSRLLTDEAFLVYTGFLTFRLIQTKFLQSSMNTRSTLVIVLFGH